MYSPPIHGQHLLSMKHGKVQFKELLSQIIDQIVRLFSDRWTDRQIDKQDNQHDCTIACESTMKENVEVWVYFDIHSRVYAWVSDSVGPMIDCN